MPLLDVRPEERRSTFAAFFALLAVTTGHTLLETARDTLFLAKMPASRLPWMYLVIVAIAFGLAQIGRRARVDSKAGIVAGLAIGAVITTLFGLPTSLSATLLYALYAWTGLFASWVMVQIWTLLGRAYTITQAKRLYGFIGSGAVLGGVVGAVVARGAMAMAPPRESLFVAAIVMLLAALPVVAIRLAEQPEEPVRISEPGDAPQMTTGMSLLWQNAFARRVLGIVLVSTVTVTIADYVFKSVVAHEIHDAAQLGAVFSTFYAITNTFGLVAQLFIAPWIFRTFGVQRALFAFPALIFFAAGGVVATAAIGGLLVAVMALKGIDGVLRYSLHRTSAELLLVPVPDLTRERIKPIVDLVGTRGGQALASVGILFLVAFNAGKPKLLGAVLLTLSLVWLALVYGIRALYLDVFRETLKSGGLSGKAELPELDLGMLETLFAGLNSSRDGEVLASLELLAEQHRERLIPALILYHPSRDVVLRALELFAKMDRTDFVPIADRLNAHPDRDVAAAALRARTAVQPERELLEKRIDEDCDQVSVTALVALMSRGWIREDEAKKRLEKAFASRSWRAAAELARAIRDVASERREGIFEDRFDELLVKIAHKASTVIDASCVADEAPKTTVAGPMFDDPPEIKVQIEVARAMAVRKSPRFLPVLVNMLADQTLRGHARDALREIPGALEALDQAIATPSLPRAVRVQVPRAMAQFDPEKAAPLLAKRLQTTEDGTVRYKTLRALVRLRRQAPSIRLDASALTRSAEVTLDHVAELRKWGNALSGGSDEAPTSVVHVDPLRAAHHLLVDLVRDKEVHATERLFLLLELIYHEDFEDVWRGLRSKNARRRASSLELVENIVKPPIRARIIDLVGDGPKSTRPGADVTADAYETALREILARGGSTMRTLAEFRAVELGVDVGDLARGRGIESGELARTLGKRFLERAKDLLEPQQGATRAPA
ncbi:MAG TPA: hypothetical protein VIF62_34380 [Labilithrix sp.]